MASWKEGDRVRIVKRPVTDEDRKTSRYYEHMAGLTGTVQNVYEGDLVAVHIDPDTLPEASRDVHTHAVERMREKFLGNFGEEAKKMMTKEELEFGAHFMSLVKAADLEKAG